MLSIIVPVYNEKESLQAFYAELGKELQKLREVYEVLFIDDGSVDGSLAVLKQFEKKDTRVRIYSFRKNQGKAEALTLGFQKARGDILVTLDADLQDKPSEIKKLLDKQKESGVDVVSGWRKDRKDTSRMVLASRLFNYVTGWIFDVHLHDFNCGLKVYTADAAKSLQLYGGMHRFIPLLLSVQGFTVDEVVVEHERRKFGVSKYRFTKVKDLPDMFTMLFLTRYSKRPLHFFGPAGGLLTGLGSLVLLYLFSLRLMGEKVGDRPLLTFGVLLFLAGLQIFFTGFLAELITESAQRNNGHSPLKYSSNRST